eukprot:10553840-Lingulodinium_polyedra.AAC.1
MRRGVEDPAQGLRAIAKVVPRVRGNAKVRASSSRFGPFVPGAFDGPREVIVDLSEEADN